MKPVLVLQHLRADGPAYLQTWLQAQQVPFDLHCSEAGLPFPAHIAGYRAMAILGGAMSANDDLPSLRQAEALIRQAVALGVPVIGHCLGGQLMARALGAAVAPAAAPEIGWTAITIEPHAMARAWFGEPGERTVFQWHYEAFSLPAGAVSLAGSPACTHQAFALGPHLALQFHVELDESKLALWVRTAESAYGPAHQRHPGTVQGLDDMAVQARTALAGQQALAARLYTRWLSSPG